MAQHFLRNISHLLECFANPDYLDLGGFLCAFFLPLQFSGHIKKITKRWLKNKRARVKADSLVFEQVGRECMGESKARLKALVFQPIGQSLVIQ